MTRDQQRLADYVAHMLEAIERIDRYTAGMDGAGFLKDLLVQDAVVRNLEIIGEASNNIGKRYPDFAAEHPELPLAAAYQMRNVVAHGYFKVDHQLVWTTIRTELPKLHRQLRAVVASLAPPGTGSAT